VNIILAVDELESVQDLGPHPQHGDEGERLLAALEELLQVGAEPVDDDEAQPLISEEGGAESVAAGHAHVAPGPPATSFPVRPGNTHCLMALNLFRKG